MTDYSGTHWIALGLGTNIGNRLQQLEKAVNLLVDHRIIMDWVCSPIYESIPQLPKDAPKRWECLKYLNMAVTAYTSYSPQELLKQVKFIEQKMGRVEGAFWSPRPIDIDILLYEDQLIQQDDLIIPHPYLLERDFALVPLADICPDRDYPIPSKEEGDNKTMAALCDNMHKHYNTNPIAYELRIS